LFAFKYCCNILYPCFPCHPWFIPIFPFRMKSRGPTDLVNRPKESRRIQYNSLRLCVSASLRESVFIGGISRRDAEARRKGQYGS
jgi:hypothetical protein